MATLSQLLGYFERDDVDEVRLQSGAPVIVSQGGRSRPLTKQPVSGSQVVGFLRGSPVEAMLPSKDTSGDPETVMIDGRQLVVVVARHGDLLQIRFSRPKKSTPRPVAARRPAPAQVSPQRAASPGQAAPARAKTPPREPKPAAAPTPASKPRPRPVASASSIKARPGDLPGLLRSARDAGASDVHVMSERPCAVRIGGALQPVGEPVSDAQVRAMLIDLVPREKRAQLEELGYCDFAVEVPGAGRFRANLSRHRKGLKGCFRTISEKPPTLEELNLPPELAQVTKYHQGLAIISGPSGQGKTTTMAALVDMLNASKPIHIITVEDPVEFLHPIKKAVMSQREVGAHTKTFYSALKAALREDPDVIVLGELRDRETVEMALSAAETGHLVIATMSTPSGAKTIDRLIDMFPPDDQAQVRATLAGALKIVVSQRLLPRADGRGQVAASELITGNIPLWTLIRDNKLFQLPSLLQRGRAFGMIRIDDSLAQLVLAGLITEDVARQYADDPRFLDPKSEREHAPVSQEGKRGGLRNLFGKGGS